MASVVTDIPLRAAPAGHADGTAVESHWRPLLFFNGYRFISAGLLISALMLFGSALSFGSANPRLFSYAGFGYVLFAMLSFGTIAARRHFQLQLSIQVAADVVFITLMMHASGGISSGLGLLLMSSLAAAGLISRGRLTLFYAALATIAVLVEQTLQVLYGSAPTTQYIQTGFISIAYFATGWVAHTLAKYLTATEQLAAQREIDLADLSEVNQLVLQDMQDGVLVVDAAGTIRQFNSRAEQMLGLVPRGRALAAYAPALAQRLDSWRFRPAPPAVSGLPEVVPVNETVGARFVPVGRSRSVGAVIFLEDMTQVRSQAREMKLASLGRITANIAHEIRNPLSAISHASELLQEEPALDPTVGRLLVIVRDNVERLNRIVNDVLKLNRGASAHRERFRLAAFVHTFVEQFAQIEKISPEVFEVSAADDPEIEFDRSHLNQVMWNLCRNALRHCSRAAGSIRIIIGVEGDGDIVRLDVVDDGAGVPLELRSQLFEPFFTTDSAGGGSGLGLYIAREVSEANQAMLNYVETAGGAQFSILCRRVNA